MGLLCVWTGDALFVPPGWVHAPQAEAQAEAAEPSLHVTVGADPAPFRWRELLALSVGSTQLELEVDGVAPLYVPLPKPVDVDAATVAKYNKKTGLLKVTLRLAS